MRAAMVGGTAYYAGKKVQDGRQADYDRDARLAELEAQQQQQQLNAPPPPPSKDEVIAQLEKLGELKDKGILDDAEFTAQKQKLLGAL